MTVAKIYGIEESLGQDQKFRAEGKVYGIGKSLGEDKDFRMK